MTDQPSLNAQIIGLGVSKSYASELVAGIKTPGLPLALRIYRATQKKLGPIASATEAEIRALEKVTFHGAANNDGPALRNAEQRARNPRKAGSR